MKIQINPRELYRLSRDVSNYTKKLLLARSKHGERTLKLTIDEVGLKYEFKVPDTEIGKQAKEMTSRGDYSGSSFAFTIAEGGLTRAYDPTTKIYTHIITGIDELFDVTLTVRPAYQQTSVTVRCEEKNEELEAEQTPLKQEIKEEESTPLEQEDKTFIKEKEMIEEKKEPEVKVEETRTEENPKTEKKESRSFLNPYSLNTRSTSIAEEAAELREARDKSISISLSHVYTRANELIMKSFMATAAVASSFVPTFTKLPFNFIQLDRGERPVWLVSEYGEASVLGELEEDVNNELTLTTYQGAPGRINVNIPISREAIMMADEKLLAKIYVPLVEQLYLLLDSAIFNYTNPYSTAGFKSIWEGAKSIVHAATTPHTTDTLGALISEVSNKVGLSNLSNFGFVADPSTFSKLITTKRDADSGRKLIEKVGDDFVFDGFKVICSNGMKANSLGFGDFSKAGVAQYDEASITVNPYRQSGVVFYDVKALFNIASLDKKAFAYYKPN